MYDVENGIFDVHYNVKRRTDMIRMIICDDDDKYLSTMLDVVQGWMSEKKIPVKVHSYSKFEEIGEPILASCDIALLDIDFARKNYTGIDIARKLRTLRPDTVIVFVTNYIEYAPEGYEVKAFRYILKKDVQQKLSNTLNLAMDELATSRETLKIKIEGEIIDLRLRDIVYIESHLRKVSVHMKKVRGNTGKEYSYYATMADLEKQLEPRGFLRIHKSYLVNMRHIRRFANKEILLDEGTLLSVGEKNYAEKKSKFLIWRGYQ